jgi:hypothetical protein
VGLDSIGDLIGQRREGYGTLRGVNGETILRPIRAGAYARQLWPTVLSAVEERWRTRFGGDVVDGLRDALAARAVPMPWSPPEVHPSDGFSTHIIDGPPSDSERPSGALLGQVLTALTLDHEQNAEASLPLAADVMRVIDTGVVRLRDLPALSGISKEGTAMATGYLQRRGLAKSGPVHAISLTPEGLHALDDYRHRAARPKASELRGALEATLGRREALSAGLVPLEGCWRGEKPYLTSTQRLLADPTGSLPWHPMVLHRGGWPDAS